MLDSLEDLYPTGNPTFNINSPNAGQSTTTGPYKSSRTDELQIVYFPIRELFKEVKMVYQQCNSLSRLLNESGNPEMIIYIDASSSEG